MRWTERGSAPRRRGASGDDFTSISYSILSAGALQSLVTERYEIEAVTCDLVGRGLHDTYVLATVRDRYLLRVYRASWRSGDEIGWEVDLSLHLAASGVPVSVPMESRDSRRTLTISTPEGTRHLMLFPYPAGSVLTWAEPEHCRMAGEVLGAMHYASDQFAMRSVGPMMNADTLVDEPIAAIRPFLSHRPSDVRDLEALAASLRRRLIAASEAGLSWGVCHGSFIAKDLHVSGDRHRVRVDLERPARGWRASDFVDVWRFTSGEASVPASWNAFVDGYRRAMPCPSIDLSMVRSFRVARQLTDLGLAAQRVDESGTLKISDRKIGEILTALREWECADAVAEE